MGDGTPHPSGDDIFIFDQRYCEVPMADFWDVDEMALV